MAFFYACMTAVPLLAGEYKHGVIRCGHRAFVELFEDLLQRLEWYGSAEQVALDEVAAKLIQKLKLLGDSTPSVTTCRRRVWAITIMA